MSLRHLLNLAVSATTMDRLGGSFDLPSVQSKRKSIGGTSVRSGSKRSHFCLKWMSMFGISINSDSMKLRLQANMTISLRLIQKTLTS